MSKPKRPVKMRKITELKQYPVNSRTHSEEQIEQVRASLREFEFTNPILIDEEDIILAGHARLEAAELEEYTEVPTIVLTGLTDTQKKAYVIADNKLALNAGWNQENLAAELKDLDELGEFDLTLTGFDAEELDDFLLGDLYEPDIDKERVEKAKKKYMDGDVRQIILYFENDQYEDILKQLIKIQKEEKLEDNSQALVYLLAMYEDCEEAE